MSAYEDIAVVVNVRRQKLGAILEARDWLLVAQVRVAETPQNLEVVPAEV